MRRAIGLLAIVAVLAAVTAHAQEDPRRAKAEELLTVMKVAESVEKTFAMMKEMLLPAQMERMKEVTGEEDMDPDAVRRTNEVLDMIAEELSWDKMKEDYITLYAETFTEEEMDGIIAFYKSPAGQTFLAKQPELMKRSMEMTQGLMVRIMPKIKAMATGAEEPTPAEPIEE